jgi:hypothetical protein
MRGSSGILRHAREDEIGDGKIKGVVLEYKLSSVYRVDFDWLRGVIGELGLQPAEKHRVEVGSMDLEANGRFGVHDRYCHSAIAATIVMDDGRLSQR